MATRRLDSIEETEHAEDPSTSGCSDVWRNHSMNIYKADMGSETYQERLNKANKCPSKSASKVSYIDKGKMSLAVSRLKAVVHQNNSLVHQYNAVAATGYAVFLADQRLPSNEFIVPGRRHRVRIRFCSLGCHDDAGSCPRAAYMKFADQHDEGPLDLLLSTGRVALARNMKTLYDVISYSKKDLKHACRDDPNVHFALVDGCRKAPNSFSDLQYYSKIAYKLIDHDNNENMVRFRLVPDEELPESGLLVGQEQETPWETERSDCIRKANNYLRKEFRDRILTAPIKYKLQMQIHHETLGKNLDVWNAQTLWNEDKSPWFSIAEITATTPVPPAVARRTTFTIRNRPCCLKLDPPVSTKDYRSLHRGLTIIHNIIEEKRPASVVQAGDDIPKTEKWQITLATEQVIEDDTPATVDVYIILTGTEGRCTAAKLVSAEKEDSDTDAFSDEDEEEKQERHAKKTRMTSCDQYEIQTEPVGDLLTIMVHVRHRSMLMHWFLRYVIVSNEAKTVTQKFPCYRVVLNRVVLAPGTVALPNTDHRDIMQHERLLELNERRRMYSWKKVEGLPSVLAATELTDLPDTEQYIADRYQHIRWNLEPNWNETDVKNDRLQRRRTRRINSSEMIGQALNPSFAFYRYGYRTLQSRVQISERKESLQQKSKRMNSEGDAAEKRASAMARARWRKAKIMIRFALNKPQRIKCDNGKLNHMCRACDDDEAFGNWFQEGPNPYTIKQIQEIPDNFDVKSSQVENYLERNMKLDEEAQAGNIYLLNYKILDELPRYDNKGDMRYLAAPMCLLYMDKRGELLPIAIQLHQQPASNNPVWTPADRPEDWLMAKLWVRNADYQVYHFVEHIFRCHLLTEPFAVATMRQLSIRHPLYKLLRPHFRTLLVSNFLMRRHLLEKGGSADKVSSLGGGGQWHLLKKAYRQLNFDSLDCDKDLKMRGVDNPRRPKYYPYRDDATQHSAALRKYVRSILETFYGTDAVLCADTELKAWYKDLINNGFNFKDGENHGLPVDITSLGELEDILTMVLFTCTCAHCAVQNEAIDIYGYLPDVPGAMYRPPPTQKGKVNVDEILATLPEQSLMGYQTAMAYLVRDCQREKESLRDCRECHFTDPEALRTTHEYVKDLIKLSNTIKERCKDDPDAGYMRLLPENIPPSIDPLPKTLRLADMLHVEDIDPSLERARNNNRRKQSAPLFMPLVMNEPDQLFKRRLSLQMMQRSLSESAAERDAMGGNVDCGNIDDPMYAPNTIHYHLHNYQK